MTILITGSHGFIGSRLNILLKENGYDIIPFDADISSRAQVFNLQAAKEIDVVIHLASVINKKNAETFKKVNIEGTKNIVDFCKKNKVKRLIFLSSLKALSALHNPYIDSKKEAEKIIIDSGLPYIILRPSMVYGPGDKKNIGFLIKLAKNLPLMPGLKFRMQLLFIDDLVKIITGSLSLPPNQIINIAGRTESYMDLLKALRGMGLKFSIINWPKFFAIILKMASLLGLLSLPAWQVDSLMANEIFDESNWQKLFNLEETSFEDGLKKTLNR
jgi:nucleoside-diphosphate-sugar epimerase